jgi:hypothetical protein
MHHEPLFWAACAGNIRRLYKMFRPTVGFGQCIHCLYLVRFKVAAAAAVLQAAATWTDGATGMVAFFVVNDDNSSAVYQYVEAVAGGILLTELTVLGTVDAKIVVGDLLFA